MPPELSVESSPVTVVLAVVLLLSTVGCVQLGGPRGEPYTPYEPEVQKRLDSRDVPETHPNATLQDTETVEYWIVAYVNHERVESGVEPLVWSPRLSQIADYRSYDMAKREYFSHKYDGTVMYVQAAKRFQYSHISTSAENIASKPYGKKTQNMSHTGIVTYDDPKHFARALVRGWMISGAHRWALMNAEYTVTGVGVYGSPNGSTQATQLFANREKFDEFVNANTTDRFRVPIADEDPMEDESGMKAYPEDLDPNAPND